MMALEELADNMATEITETVSLHDAAVEADSSGDSVALGDEERPTTPESHTAPSAASAHPETPKASRLSIDRALSPSEPDSPITPRDSSNSSTRDSMTSIALSETSLDYDHLAKQHVNDALATPRASGIRHMRKPSSLEIIRNSWGPPIRQSTLFDTEKDQPPDTPLEEWAGIASEHRLSPDEDTESTKEYTDSELTRSPVPSISESLAETATSDLRSSNLDSSATSLRSISAASSDEPHEVDWSQLDKNEEQEKEDKDIPEGAEDESTAFLLARLEQENAKFSQDPKSAVTMKRQRSRKGSRPPSMAHLKKLVQSRHAPSIRYSLAPDMPLPEEPPPMTELEFWAALVQDYTSTAARLPTLTTTKIRSGIPPPLRGVVWTSMSGARDRSLEEAYENLKGERSPYEGIINKDVGRSFPGVDLFRETDGEGQKMLGRVLKCFSLHDKDIGYCQGLGFLVGPLLMNMGERDAFCVLVRLMDHFALRPSFLPSLSGLHMRIFQFSSLLKEHNATLSQHLTDLGVEPAYLSQWFLSCFAVTCPLPLLFRIYDVIFAEGANETVMRVAMALMRRNEEAMLASTEFEEVMQLLLGRAIWDPYGCNPDELVDDFTSLGGIITHARLGELEKEFEMQSTEVVGQSAGFLPDVQAAASRFLGRLWAPSHSVSPSKASTLSPSTAEKEVSPGGHGRSPSFFLRRSPSKQSVSTVNESTASEGTQSSGSLSTTSTVPTEADAIVSVIREISADGVSIRSKAESSRNVSTSLQGAKEQQELHGQIEDLLTALSEMQREHAQLSAMLQKEREERNEDHRLVRQLIEKMKPDDSQKADSTPSSEPSKRHTLPPRPSIERQKLNHQRQISQPCKLGSSSELESDVDYLLAMTRSRLNANARFSSSFETKAQLRSNLARTREQLAAAEARSRELVLRQQTVEESVMTYQTENEDLRNEVKELRSRVNDEFRRRQKQEHTIREIKAEMRSIERKERERFTRTESSRDVMTLARLETGEEGGRANVTSAPVTASAGGLRQLRLGREGRRESTSSVQSARIRDSVLKSPTGDDIAVPFSPTLATPLSPTPTTPSSAIISQSSGFGQRTTSLFTQEVLATPEHEVVPEDALLLELVNAKTAEAQARQEVDEMRRNLNIQKRKHDELLVQLQSEIASAKEEARKANENAAAARAEAAAIHLGAPTTPLGESESKTASVQPPTTPGAAAKASPAPTPPASSSSVGGWFWSRRTASTAKAVVPTDD